MNRYEIWFSLFMTAALGVAIGWTAHATNTQLNRCYRDEPCPFGPGIVGQKKCSGGQLDEKCEAPEHPMWRNPTESDIEVIQGIVREELRKNGCGVPPLPPAHWADGGYGVVIFIVSAAASFVVVVATAHAVWVILRETRKRDGALRDQQEARDNLARIEEMKREDAKFLRRVRRGST